MIGFVASPILHINSTSHSFPISRRPILLSTEITPAESHRVITTLWTNFREHRFAATTILFAPNAILNDTLYPQPFKGPEAIFKYFSRMEKTIPKSLKFVLDDIAAGGPNVGARWHVESEDGNVIPFGRGLSMYHLVRDDEGKNVLIGEAWDFPEPFLKVAPLVLGILKFVGTIWGRKKSAEGRHSV